jgi:hypothetical protein
MGRRTKEEEVALRIKVEELLKEGKSQRKVAAESGACLQFVNKVAQQVLIPVDKAILMKMIPVFIEKKMQVGFTKKEIARIQVIYKDVSFYKSKREKLQNQMNEVEKNEE